MGLYTYFAGFRRLSRNPRFAATVIVVLALGIGINVATLGLLYRYYVSPLPHPQGGRIASVYFTSAKIPALAPQQQMSVPTWQRLDKGAPALADSGIYRGQGYNMVVGNRRSRLHGIAATASVFSTLGVQPVLGHVFGSRSNRLGAQPVAVLSYRLWQGLFDGKASALGQALHLNGKLYTVIGVMPKNFAFPTSKAALWTPYTITRFDESPKMLTEFGFHMVARLARGASMAAFRTQANVVLQREIANFPVPSAIQLFKQYKFGITAEGWRESRLGNLHQSLMLVFFATALLMLLVWFNLANLFLARSFARRGELTLRRVLGARPPALLGSLAFENLWLSLIGAGLGVVLGRFLLNIFSGSSIAVTASSIPAASWPALIVIAIMLAVISTAIFTAMSMGIVRGRNLTAALGDAGTHASPGRGAKRLRVSLIAGQIALACAIAGTGLLLGRGLLNLGSVNLGFNSNHVVTFQMNFPSTQFTQPQIGAKLRELRAAVARAPGIDAVSISSAIPFNGDTTGSTAFPRPPNRGVRPVVFHVATDAGHFGTFGIPLLAGRDFTPADVNSGTSYAIIDTRAAQRIFGTDKKVVGREFSFNSAQSNYFGLLFRVIGLVPAVRRAEVDAPDRGIVYVDAEQIVGKNPFLKYFWSFPNWYLAVRSPLSAAAVASEVKGIARRVIPSVPLYNMRTMNQRRAGSLASNRLLTVLVLLFAVGALVLAAIGLYAVQAYAVAQRAREFAIRAALGADRSRLLAMVLGEAARLLVIGLVVGLAGLAGIGIAFASAFYGIAAVDPASMAIVAVVLALAALAASWFPAWRASRVAPDKALRNI